MTTVSQTANREIGPISARWPQVTRTTLQDLGRRYSMIYCVSARLGNYEYIIEVDMDPLYEALCFFRQRRYQEAADKCTVILHKNAYDQAAWCLKLRCLTEQVYVDEVENDEEGIAESVLDDNKMASVARPGTSLNKPATGQGMPSQAIRPLTQSGRPVSGVVRPGTQSGRPGTMDQALRTPRTARTARPVTSTTGRFVRLGTASMISNVDGPFVNVSRLNFGKYAADKNLSKPLFEYLFYHENDVRNALQLASLATQACQFKDWYWKVQLGKCYYRLGLYRDAEKQFKSAVNQDAVIDTFLMLAKVYTRLDQPLNAVDVYKQGLDKFPNDICLLIGLARIHEGLGDLNQAVTYYKDVVKQDSTNIEAIACIGANYFYNDQPEISLRFYRRLLQMGVFNAEIFINIGLCCYYSQQYDLAMQCMERATKMASDDVAADVWYNVGVVSLAAGDVNMGTQAFRLALRASSDHVESYCNLGVLEMRKGNLQMAKSMFQSAMTHDAYTFEPFFNYALLCYQTGDLQASYITVKKALDIFPQHSDSLELQRKLKENFISV